MITHHSVTGCNMRVGDLLGSGTISGTEQGSHGAFIEATENGKKAVKLDGGEERMYLEDGDTVTIRGVCVGNEGELVGFGNCEGVIMPAVTI
jgi:fumarylacetoacetase